MTDDYTASSIRILSQEEADGRFIFNQVERLAATYTTVTRDFLRRLLEAAAVTGTPLEHIERRYLVGDRSVPKSLELEAALLHILDRERWR